MLPLLILIKFILYWFICRLAPKMLSFDVAALPKFAFKWAGIRLLVGLLGGILMFYAYALLQHNGLTDTPSYILSFAIGRYFEWLLVLVLILKSVGKSPPIGARGQLWLAIGVGVNIALDCAVLFTGAVDDLKFFC